MDDLSNIWGDPYRYGEIEIYPVKMEDCLKFYKYASCLTYEKNKIQDVNIIKMSYLRFLFYISASVDEKGNNFSYLIENLKSLLELVFQTGVEYQFFTDKDEQLKGIEILVDGKYVINENKFEKIRKTILDQNLIKLSDMMFDPELEKALKEAQDFMASKSTNATLEEQIITYRCLSGQSYKEIKNETIYQFSKGLQRFAIIKNFEVYSTLYAENGKAQEIQHFLCHIQERGMYDDVIMSKESLDNMTADSTMFSKK